MASFGVEVVAKLSQSTEAQFRADLQAVADKCTPVIKKIQLDVNSSDLNQELEKHPVRLKVNKVTNIQNALNKSISNLKNGLNIEITSFKATQAIQTLKAEIETMLRGINPAQIAQAPVNNNNPPPARNPIPNNGRGALIDSKDRYDVDANGNHTLTKMTDTYKTLDGVVSKVNQEFKDGTLVITEEVSNAWEKNAQAVETAKTKYTSLENTLTSLQEKIAAEQKNYPTGTFTATTVGTDGTTTRNLATEVQAQLSALRNTDPSQSGFVQAIAEIENTVKRLKNSFETAKNEADKLPMTLKAASAEVTRLDTNFHNLQNNISGKVANGEFDASTFGNLSTRLESNLSNLQQYITKASTGGLTKNDIVAISKLSEELKKCDAEYKNLIATAPRLSPAVMATATDVNALKAQVDSFMRSNSQAASKFSVELKQITSALSSSSIDLDTFKGLKQEFENITSAAKIMGLTSTRIRDQLKDTFKTLGGFTSFAGALRMSVRWIKQLWSEAKELDSAMTQLRIVCQESDAVFNSFFKDAAASAQNLGTSISKILNSVEVFARLGYSLSDALELGNVATMMSNVAAVSVDEATSGMTSILKGFNFGAEDAEHIADVLTKVGKEYAVSAAELMEALQKGGASLQVANNTLSESVALIAAGNAAIQNASTVGTALKTTTLRLRASTGDASALSELGEMGEDVEELAVATSSLRNEMLALSGVDIMISDTEFKSTYQILKEIAAVYDDLSETNQAAVLEAIAGKRNSSVIQSIITNVKDLTGAYEAAENATGAVSKANETYLDSIEGRFGQIEASVQSLGGNLFSDDLVKEGISLINLFIKLADKLAELKLLIPVVTASLWAFMTVPKANTLNSEINKMASSLSSILTAGGKSPDSILRVAQALSLLDETQRKLVMSRMNLNATEAQSINNDIQQIALGNIISQQQAAELISNEIYTKTQTDLILQAIGYNSQIKTREDLINLLIAAEADWNNLQLSRVAMTGVETDVLKDYIIELRKRLELEAAASSAGGATGSNGGGAKGFLAAAFSVNKLGSIISLITTIISLGSMAYSLIKKNRQEQEAAYEEAITEYDEITTELENLQSQYEENLEVIKELNAAKINGSITTQQQEELNLLEGQNDELQRQIDFQETLARLKAKEVSDNADDLLDDSDYDKWLGSESNFKRFIDGETTRGYIDEQVILNTEAAANYSAEDWLKALYGETYNLQDLYDLIDTYEASIGVMLDDNPNKERYLQELGELQTAVIKLEDITSQYTQEAIDLLKQDVGSFIGKIGAIYNSAIITALQSAASGNHLTDITVDMIRDSLYSSHATRFEYYAGLITKEQASSYASEVLGLDLNELTANPDQYADQIFEIYQTIYELLYGADKLKHTAAQLGNDVWGKIYSMFGGDAEKAIEAGEGFGWKLLNAARNGKENISKAEEEIQKAKDVLTSIDFTDSNSAVGTSIDDFVSAYNTLSTATANLRQDLATPFDGETLLNPEDVIALIEEYPKLAEYVDLTAEGYGNLAEGLEAINRENVEKITNKLQGLIDGGEYDETTVAALENIIDAISLMNKEFGELKSNEDFLNEWFNSEIHQREGQTSITQAKDALRSFIEEFNSSNGLSGINFDSILGDTLTELVDQIPLVENDITSFLKKVESGTVTAGSAYDLLNKINAEFIKTTASTYAEQIDDIISAYDDYGSKAEAVQREILELTNLSPGLAAALLNVDGTIVQTTSSTFQSAESFVTWAKAAVLAAKEANAISLKSINDELENNKTQWQNGAISTLQYITVTRQLKSERLDLNTVAEELKRAWNELNAIDSSFFSDSSGSSSSSTDKYLAEIDRIYEETYKLEKLLWELEMSEAKLDTLDESSYEKRNEYLREQIDLMSQINSALHVQTEARRNLIREDIESINSKLGGNKLGISYDGYYNDLHIAGYENFQAIAEAAAIANGFTLATDEGNEFVEELWDLVEQIQEFNEENKEASVEYFSNKSQLEEYKREFADNVIAPFDEYIEYCDDFDVWNDVDYNKLDVLRSKIEAINDLYEQQYISYERFIELNNETAKEIYDAQKDALDEILDLTIELIKQELEDQKDALEEQYDTLKELVDLEKERVDALKAETDYQKTIEEKVKEISKLKEQITLLGLDDSREAAAQRASLEEELAGLQSELADTQSDYKVDTQKEALDKMLDAAEAEKDAETQVLEEYLNNSSYLYEMAIARINANWNQLYTDLIAYNNQYGDSIAGQDSIASAWEIAFNAAQKYGDYVSALSGIKLEYAESNQASPDAALTSVMMEAAMPYVTKMKENSVAALDLGAARRADPENAAKYTEEISKLHKQNVEWAAIVAELLGKEVTYGTDKVWYINGQELYKFFGLDKYHSGGVVGNALNLKDNEVMAILEKGELVFDKAKKEGIYEIIDFTSDIFTRFRDVLKGVSYSNIGGLNAARTALIDEMTPSNVSNNSIVFSPSISVSIAHSGTMTERDANNYGNQIANTTLSALQEAFQKKGISPKVRI